MVYPVRALLVVALASRIAAAEAEENATTSSRERAVSTRVAGMLSAAAPKFSPPPAVESSASSNSHLAPREPVSPANGIVRLPEYIVRERKPAKLPEREEVMSPHQLEQIAMQHFLGDEQGLERALSMITPIHLWRKIPVLGKFPFRPFRTNEERAMGMYRAAQEAERWENLTSLLSPKLKPEAPLFPPTK